MLRRMIAVAAVAVAAIALLAWSQRRGSAPRVSGFIEADEVRLGSRVGGRVAKVLISEGQRVKKGEVLVQLEPFDLQEKKAAAEAELARARSVLEKLKAGYRAEEIAQARAKVDELRAKLAALRSGPRPQEIAAAEARVRAAESELELAQATIERVKQALAASAVGAGEMDQATRQLKSSQANLQVRKEELNLLKAGTRAEDIAAAEALLAQATAAAELAERGNRVEDIAQAAAGAQAAEAALKVIEQQVAELSITAPIDGVIEAMELRPGDMVSPSAPVLSMLDTSTLWVRAYVPENRLNLSFGQKLYATVDSFPDRRFAGHISFVARQAEFTPNNVQTPEERSKQVFRIKLTLDEGLDVLRPGMAADVWLEG